MYPPPRARPHREATHLFVLAPEATAHHLHQRVEGLARVLIEDHLFTELIGVEAKSGEYMK